MLTFCEYEKIMSMLMYFSSAGRYDFTSIVIVYMYISSMFNYSPIKITAEDKDYSVELIMATLSSHISQEPESQMGEGEGEEERDAEVVMRRPEDEEENVEPAILDPLANALHGNDNEASASRYSSHAELLVNLKNSPVKARDGPRIVDFSHFDMFMHSPSQQSSENLPTKKQPTSSARKRRIIDDDPF